MFANRFARDSYNCNGVDGDLRVEANDSSPRSVRGSKRQTHSDSTKDFLANRVSFYMDEALPSPNDQADGSALDLRYQQSIKRLHHPRVLLTRERSFRVGERRTVKLSRHASDVCPTSHARLQRNRSVNGGKRLPRRRDSYGGSIERSDSRTIERFLSLHSTGSGSAKVRHQRSHSVCGSSKRSSTRRDSSHLHRKSSLKMPHKELHPKERRRRIVVLMVVITFLFLVACSVLAVVVTLTHSSFHRNSYYLPGTEDHLHPRINYTGTGN
jgi:hypothetical protein